MYVSPQIDHIKYVFGNSSAIGNQVHVPVTKLLSLGMAKVQTRFKSKNKTLLLPKNADNEEDLMQFKQLGVIYSEFDLTALGTTQKYFDFLMAVEQTYKHYVKQGYFVSNTVGCMRYPAVFEIQLDSERKAEISGNDRLQQAALNGCKWSFQGLRAAAAKGDLDAASRLASDGSVKPSSTDQNASMATQDGGCTIEELRKVTTNRFFERGEGKEPPHKMQRTITFDRVLAQMHQDTMNASVKIIANAGEQATKVNELSMRLGAAEKQVQMQNETLQLRIDLATAKKELENLRARPTDELQGKKTGPSQEDYDALKKKLQEAEASADTTERILDKTRAVGKRDGAKAMCKFLLDATKLLLQEGGSIEHAKQSISEKVKADEVNQGAQQVIDQIADLITDTAASSKVPDSIQKELEALRARPTQEQLDAESSKVPDSIQKELEALRARPTQEQLDAESSKVPDSIQKELEALRTRPTQEQLDAESSKVPDSIQKELEALRARPTQEQLDAESSKVPESIQNELKDLRARPTQEQLDALSNKLKDAMAYKRPSSTPAATSSARSSGMQKLQAKLTHANAANSRLKAALTQQSRLFATEREKFAAERQVIRSAIEKSLEFLYLPVLDDPTVDFKDCVMDKSKILFFHKSTNIASVGNLRLCRRHRAEGIDFSLFAQGYGPGMSHAVDVRILDEDTALVDELVGERGAFSLMRLPAKKVVLPYPGIVFALSWMTDNVAEAVLHELFRYSFTCESIAGGPELVVCSHPWLLSQFKIKPSSVPAVFINDPRDTSRAANTKFINVEATAVLESGSSIQITLPFVLAGPNGVDPGDHILIDYGDNYFTETSFSSAQKKAICIIENVFHGFSRGVPIDVERVSSRVSAGVDIRNVNNFFKNEHV